ncbi:MAG: DUF4870 domain-containing protein [Planctomycetota bacterium]|jgi:uncharacterized Tic20 family protein
MSIADELARLEDLWRAGTLSDEEFAAAKERVLAEDGPPAAPAAGRGLEADTRQWAMFLHLSLLAGLAVPAAGFVAPIVIWQVKKEELPGIDPHGRMAVNWLISFVIYMVGSAILSIILIGIPMMLALGVCGVVFPVIAGLKANQGELWKYPLTIEFFKSPERETTYP